MFLANKYVKNVFRFDLKFNLKLISVGFIFMFLNMPAGQKNPTKLPQANLIAATTKQPQGPGFYMPLEVYFLCHAFVLRNPSFVMKPLNAFCSG